MRRTTNKRKTSPTAAMSTGPRRSGCFLYGFVSKTRGARIAPPPFLFGLLSSFPFQERGTHSFHTAKRQHIKQSWSSFVGTSRECVFGVDLTRPGTHVGTESSKWLCK